MKKFKSREEKKKLYRCNYLTGAAPDQTKRQENQRERKKKGAEKCQTIACKATLPKGGEYARNRISKKTKVKHGGGS